MISKILHNEKVNAITTRGGKTTRDPPYPEATKKKVVIEVPAKEEAPVVPKEKEKTAPHVFFDTEVLPFPESNRKATKDEQFKKFVEVIQKLYIHVPLIDAMQVPTYAKYLKDILNKEKSLPSVEIVKFTEECSAAILNQLPKKKDLGNPTISCSIGS